MFDPNVCLFQVLKINLIGHRKRILASLGDRLHEDPPQKPPRSITLRVSAQSVHIPRLYSGTFNKMTEAVGQEVQAAFHVAYQTRIKTVSLLILFGKTRFLFFFWLGVHF